MAKYPKRESHFAHKLARLMIRVCAAQEIGVDACWLVTIIAHTEDAKRYSGPVTWWNEQLRSVLGFTSWGKLDRARKRAVGSGWLHYEPGGKGKVGKYWATVPDQFRDIPNGAVDEDNPVILSASGDESRCETPLSSPPVVTQTREKPVILSTGGERTGGQPGDNRGTSGDHSTLTLNPSPSPKKDTATAVDIPAKLQQLINGWNALGLGIVKKGNGVRSTPPSKAVLKGWNRAQQNIEQREVLEDIVALLTAIRGARFCHKEGWFTLAWLFGKNRNEEYNIVKVKSGAHDDRGNQDGKAKQSGAYDDGSNSSPGDF